MKVSSRIKQSKRKKKHAPKGLTDVKYVIETGLVHDSDIQDLLHQQIINTDAWCESSITVLQRHETELIKIKVIYMKTDGSERLWRIQLKSEVYIHCIYIKPSLLTF